MRPRDRCKWVVAFHVFGQPPVLMRRRRKRDSASSRTWVRPLCIDGHAYRGRLRNR